VRWYLRYSLSYRDLEEMMLERGLQVDHTTIYRWGLCCKKSRRNVMGVKSLFS
jgi:transposase-like protein